MTTELTIDAPGVTDLTPAEMDALIAAEIASSEEANAFVFRPVRVTMPTGSKIGQFTIGDSIAVETITGVICVSQPVRAYWPSDKQLGKPPVCSSPDGRSGWLTEGIDLSEALRVRPRHPGLSVLDTAPIAYSCADCPLSRFSTLNGVRQRPPCKDLRRLLFWIEGWAKPVIITLPPTSIKKLDNFATAQTYKGKQFAYFTCKVTLSLVRNKSEDGFEYYEVKIDHQEELLPEDKGIVLAIRRQYAELVRKLAIASDDYPMEETPF